MARETARHGTLGGYNRHKRLGEEPCSRCVAGARAKWAEDSEAKRKARAKGGKPSPKSSGGASRQSRKPSLRPQKYLVALEVVVVKETEVMATSKEEAIDSVLTHVVNTSMNRTWEAEWDVDDLAGHVVAVKTQEVSWTEI
jgi:hypothetical protein